MRYVQLRAFHNVAVYGGFSRAAHALSLTQPALSDQVAKLEEEYDVLLFDRQKKRIALTAFGEELLTYTRRLFDIEKQTQELLTETQALKSGTLRIMADSPHHLLDAIAAFRAEFGGIFVTIKTGNTDEVTSALLDYTCDIGVLGEVPPSKKFNVLKLSSTPITAFVSIEHPLAHCKNITIETLAKQHLVLRETGSKTRQIVMDFAAKRGIKLNASILAEGREAVREIVASGVGIGFVSSAEFGYDRRLVQIPIEGLDQHMDEALVTLKDRQNSKLIRAFMTLAKRQAADK